MESLAPAFRFDVFGVREGENSPRRCLSGDRSVEFERLKII
jgi:hypothetical protein